MLAAVQIEATAEIVDACGARVVVTLLKGISLSDRDYPAPYLRPMRDIDLLVPEGAVCEVQQTLLGLGYREHPEERVESYGHHAVPLVHPRTGIWVEVHHRLFPPDLGLPGVDPFRPDRVNARIRPSTFTGRLVNRLTDDLQVVYTASHWALSPSRIYNGGGVVAMLDLIHLLKRRGFLWDDVMALVEGSVASAHLYLLLGYLHRSGLVDVPPGTIEHLARMQPCLNSVGGRLLHGILDQYVVDGREYRGLARPGTVDITWRALLGPGPPMRNLARVPWAILDWARVRMYEHLVGVGRRTIRRRGTASRVA